jgi:hypothetical protein
MEIQSPLDGRFFSVTSAPLLLPGGVPLMLTLCHDVTDRNMALTRLKSLNRDLERRVTERTDTLARQAEELADVAPVGLQRLRRHALFVAEIAEPAADFGGDVGAGRELQVHSLSLERLPSPFLNRAESA